MENNILLSRVLGNSPVIRTLNFLLEGRELDYSLSDIAKNANIGWTTLHRIWNILEKNKIVIATRKIGNAKLFRINLENPIVKKLAEIYDTLLSQIANDYIYEKELIK